MMVTEPEEAEMLDLIAYEHGADLRREAAAYRRAHGTRAASRADRAAPRVTARVAHVLHWRSAAPVGCEA